MSKVLATFNFVASVYGALGYQSVSCIDDVKTIDDGILTLLSNVHSFLMLDGELVPICCSCMLYPWTSWCFTAIGSMC